MKAKLELIPQNMDSTDKWLDHCNHFLSYINAKIEVLIEDGNSKYFTLDDEIEEHDVKFSDKPTTDKKLLLEQSNRLGNKDKLDDMLFKLEDIQKYINFIKHKK